jgi:multiple sugar transport system permease protein
MSQRRLPVEGFPNRPTVEEPGRNVLMRLLIGLALLVPVLVVYWYTNIGPALSTFQMSLTKTGPLDRGNAQFVGSANYDALFQDPYLGQIIGYTLSMLAARVLIAAVVPLLVGALVGGQPGAGRRFNRFLLGAAAAFLSPVGLAALWGVFASPVWGRNPSPLNPTPGWLQMASIDGARTSLLLLDGLITAGIGAAAGGAMFMAVLRGRSVSPSAGRAGIGAWLLGVLLALASLPEMFTLPYILTGGGPVRSTTTFTLQLFQQGLLRFNFGAAAAMEVVLLLFASVVAFLIWAVIAGLRLRLMFTPPAPPVEGSGVFSLLSVPLILIIGLPAVLLTLWGFGIVAANGGFTRLYEVVDIGGALRNAINGPWLAIWLVQIPVAYLAALALGFVVRPASVLAENLLFLPLLVFAFLPAEGLFIQWFNMMRQQGALNTQLVVGFAWLTGPISLLVFKLFFDGASEKYRAARAADQTATDAFINTVFLPSLAIVLVVGAALSFISANALLWPLTVTNESALFGLPTAVIQVRGQFMGRGNEVAVGAGVLLIGLLALIFAPVFALLHVLVLDRLALVAGPDVVTEKPRASAAPNPYPGSFDVVEPVERRGSL